MPACIPLPVSGGQIPQVQNLEQTMKTALIFTVIFLTACSSLNKFERRAKRGDVNACDLLVHLLNEKYIWKARIEKLKARYISTPSYVSNWTLKTFILAITIYS